jgi:hypothetical protein
MNHVQFMYESPAAYVTDQPPFANAVCKVSTSLSPTELLVRAKDVEQQVRAPFTLHPERPERPKHAPADMPHRLEDARDSLHVGF